MVEAAAKKPFGEVLKRDIFDAVGMKNTYVGKTPPVEDLFVPESEPTWNVSLGVFDR